MMEVLVKKGFMSTKEPLHVTQISRKATYGQVVGFYCDSDYNNVCFRTVLNGFISSPAFSKDNFKSGFLNEKLMELDEDMRERDVHIKCIVLVWISPEGDKIICKAGDSINVFEAFLGWGTYETQQILFFPSRTSSDFYLGSGMCLPLEARVNSGTFIYMLSDHTMSHIDKSSSAYSSSSYFVDVHDTSLIKTRQKTLDLNDYSEYLDSGRIDKVISSIEKDYFKKKKSAYSQFIAILD